MAIEKRYILAEEAEERIVSLFRKERNDAANIFNTAIDVCQDIILDMYDNAPDVVEVVRCKDCEYYIRHDKRCGLLNHGVKTDFFCKWGKRREDDDSDRT